MPSNRRSKSHTKRPAGKGPDRSRPTGRRPLETEPYRAAPNGAQPHRAQLHRVQPQAQDTRPRGTQPAEHRKQSPILVNEAPIRRAAARKCRHILERFDAVMADLNRYDTEGQPAFRAWYHRTFGATFSELNGLAEQIDYRAGLIHDIQTLRFHERLSPYEAYCKAIDMREHPERYSASWSSDSWEFGEEFEDDYNYEADREDAGGEEQFEQSWEQEMSEGERLLYIVELIKTHRTFAGLDEGSANFQTLFEQVWRLMFDEPTPSTERRRTYSDGGKRAQDATHGAAENGAALDELWLRAQQAHREGDLDGLEMARAGLEMRNARDLTGLPVADILAVHREYKEELRTLRRRHRALAKYDPAWEFTTRSSLALKRLHTEIREELAAELADRLARLSRLDLVLEQFARPAEVGGRSARQRRNSAAWRTPGCLVGTALGLPSRPGPHYIDHDQKEA